MRNRSIHVRTQLSLFLILLLMATSLIGCRSSADPSDQGSSVNESTLAASETQTFTLDELATFDGQDGRKAYIAIDGIVYDVTLVAEWGNKMHAGRFSAGKDYSEEIKSAPHGVDKLLKAVKIGVLAD